MQPADKSRSRSSALAIAVTAMTGIIIVRGKYTPPGGTVQLRLFTQSRWAVIQVSDSGVGIPPADFSHIFERFYRVDTKRSRQVGGFGLGLPIALQLIEAHGGQISVTSAVGQGSTFQIELPVR